MKKNQLIAVWIAILSSYGCNSCPDNGLGDYDDGIQRMNFSLRWQPYPNQWQAAIGAFGYIHQDSVKLYDENYILVDDFSADVGGVCSFILTEPKTPRGEDIVRQYYLYLSRQDTDTIKVEFKLKKDECDNVMNYGKFFYNNQLITQSENKNFIPAATVIKK